MSDKNEPLWECPVCHHIITNTRLQHAAFNFQCAGTFGSQAPKLVRCTERLGDYVRVHSTIKDTE